MRTIIAFVVSICVVAFIIGCGRSSRPSDLPPLYPCAVIVTQDGQPLDGAVVDFVAVDAANAKYQASSVTDANGKAVVTTYGYNGVPAGRYKVCVWKTVIEGVTQVVNNDGELVDTMGAEYRTVEPQYSNAETTPLEIEITGKKMPPTSFDVGKPIKERKSSS